jgi:hypothetical protein
VHHLDHIGIGQQRGQRLVDARHQRIDQQDPVADGDLDQGQLRPEGLFADEFGVHSHPGGQLLQVRTQRVGGVDPEGHAGLFGECGVCRLGRQ